MTICTITIDVSQATVWIQYAELEASANEFLRVEQIFSKCLLSVPSIDLWKYYLDYIRRMNNLSTGGPHARSVISQAYEFVLQHVGIDLKSATLWQDYLAFIKSGPVLSTWEEQQKNDQLRKVYQRAVIVPVTNVEVLWREYDMFENTVNKQTVRPGQYPTMI